ncbi:carboxypeptidase-like regulatory domain-containing protein [Massilia sp. PAMC28688]|uniref:carboxypeptidase regulatory-like domain-containing protein n=1 Tax=Massilia sp. PAMC28688 TaxID=2861283 RepID=UPI001C62CC33|nr:carboxypeptidase regulatory-like domain-containing protein [Massilia sp. PAMC28688]QYF95666.1 carboxypeptidase-like regulatory domain-containing protein [Massilia sp. PAMC28688]
MSKLINVTRSLMLGASLLLSLAGCGGGGNDGATERPPHDSSVGSVSGRVVDAQSGQAIAGAEVKIGDQRTTTDADGKYSLKTVTFGPQRVVQFSKAEYASNFATVRVDIDGNTVADRTLARVGVRQEVSAADGGVVTMAGSPAMVTLPAAGIVRTGGAAYTGPVMVEMTPIDPGVNPLNMPGNFRAENEAVPIESMGALQVELRDSTGALLNLAPGKTATIRIPVPAGAASPPLTMPLYYFKESTGLWVREGAATLAGSAPNQYYEGTVSHFTVWNADMPMDTIYIHGCVVNASNQPRYATVTTDGIDYFGAAQEQTGQDGKFKIAARRNSKVQVSALVGDEVGSVYVTTGDSDIVLPSCIEVGAKPPVIVQQPVALTIAPGFIATLEVVAENAAQYTWYRNGTVVYAGGRSLTLFGTAGVAGTYHVVVSNAHGSVTSTSVSVTVAMPSAPPVISQQPADVHVVTGTAPTFSVVAAGDALTYQWLRDGVEIAGAQGPELTLPAALAGDNGAVFSVRVNNAAGAVTSAGARLVVAAEAVMPAITQHPGNVTAAVGQNASFAVSASGTGPLSYQWLREGVAIAGAVDATYQTGALTQADHGVKFSVRVSNAKGTVTSNAATVSISQGSGVSGLHLAFGYGSPVNNQLAYGAVPAAGGTAVPLHPAGQGELAGYLIQGQISNGLASDFYARSMLFWKNGTLIRRDLSGPNGLPPEVRLSTITSANACGLSNGSDDVQMGNDAVNALQSWLVVQKRGPDSACNTDDDQYFAVRANMGAADAPLQVSRPVATIHSAQGALTGWLVRNGMQMQRVNADFSNPVNLFTLPADDAEFMSGAELSNTAVFSAGDGVFAVDLNAAAPAALTRLATVAADETLSELQQANPREIVFALRGTTQTRLLRYTIATGTTQAIGTVGGLGDIAIVTPTRVLARSSQGGLLSFPLAGGAPTELAGSASMLSSLFIHAGGERIWQEANGSVVSINSDGTGLQTLSGSKLAGCVLKPQTAIWSSWPECDAIMVVSGTSLRSYDAQSGAARITYGNVQVPNGQLNSFFYFSPLTAWGQAGILTQVVSNSDYSQATMLSYLLKTDQAGVTQVVVQ